MRYLLRLRMIHLLYAAVLVSAARVTFGVSGFLLAALLCAAWGWVFLSESRPRAFSTAGFFLLLAACLFGLLAPAMHAARERSQRMQCPNNLKQIGLALHHYHDIYRSFPPAYVADGNGRPMHSWRVLILPFLNQQPLYDAYRFDEPWDGPNNRLLAERMPAAYACPSHRSQASEPHTDTSYVAVVGQNTAWPAPRVINFGDIVDGTSHTLLLCEVADRQISWMEPTDLDYVEAIELLTSRGSSQFMGHIGRSFFYEWSHGRHIALADAHIAFITQVIAADDARRLLAVNDGEPLEVDEIRGDPPDNRRLRTDQCVRVILFVLLALWPLPWVWINPHGSQPARVDEPRVADEP